MSRWFSSPILFALTAVLPVLAILGWRAHRQRRAALMLLGSTPGLGAAISRRKNTGGIAAFCFSLGLTLLVTGAAGPQWGREQVESAGGRDVVVLLDMSRSMSAEQPSRFDRAKAAIEDLSWEVQRRGGHRLGLVVFAGGAKTVCPLTHDYDQFRDVLEQLGVNEPPEELRPASGGSGTRIGAGIREAVQSAHDDRFRGFQDIILISDGDDPARDEEWRAGISAARERGIPVHTVGIGDPEHPSAIPTDDGPLRRNDQPVLTKLEEKPLQEIARLTNGKYTAAHTKALPLGELFRSRIEARAGHEDEDAAGSLNVNRPRFKWFLGPALLFLALELILSRRRAAVVA
jgi:Ca-activated chloride channel family protein